MNATGKDKVAPVSAITVLMDEAQALLQKLELESSATTKPNREDTESTVQRLLDGYKKISIKNKVDSKREELLQGEISELQRRNGEVKEEHCALRGEYNAKETKIDRLDKLSKHLSSRLRSVESKATDDVKEEKESRLKMSYQFSSTIKDISQKLDQLGKKREHIVAENGRLKQVLRDCLEEFDNDQRNQQQMQMDGESENNTAKDSEADAKQSSGHEKAETHADTKQTSELIEEEKVAEVETEELTKTSKAKKIEDTNIIKQDRKDMEIEDDLSKIMFLRGKEDLLKAHTIRFMEIFDAFQIRLTKSNHLFQVKQTAVEDMTKRIKQLEKSNQQLAGRVAECAASTKIMLDSAEKASIEKVRLEKVADKYRALIDKFQTDILATEAMGAK